MSLSLKKIESIVTQGNEWAAHYRRFKEWNTNRNRFVITVVPGSSLYGATSQWLSTHVAPDKQKDVTVSSEWTSEYEEARLVLHLGSESESRVNIDGHSVVVAVMPAPTSNATASKFTLRPIAFRSDSREGSKAVLAFLEGLLQEHLKVEKTPSLSIASPAGHGWMSVSTPPGRRPESVALRAGQFEYLASDLGGFLEAEDEYVRRSIPYHRGYLFHGAPGTGKTSAARALASHYGLDVYYAPLGDLAKDTDLISLVLDVPARGVLLLEDVDVFSAASSRVEGVDRVSLSGLLNALDGVATPHGLIVIMTSNYPDILDRALIRPGRIDVTAEMLLPNSEQATRLFTFFYGVPPVKPIRPGRRTTADISEILKANMFSPEAAEAALRKRAKQ